MTFNTIACLGDSLTDPNMNMGPAWTQWTAGLERALNSAGANVVVKNLAQSGAKTGGGQTKAVLRRSKPFLPQLYPPYTNIPKIGIIYSGTNDSEFIVPIGTTPTTWVAGVVTYPSTAHGYAVGDNVFISGYDQAAINGWQPITGVTTNAFTASVAGSGTPTSASGQLWASLDTSTYLAAAMRWMQFGCIGYFDSVASLPTDGQLGDRYVIGYDTDSTGGRAVPTNILYNQLPQITGSIANNTLGNSEPTVWEYRSGQTGATGWARVARASTTPTHVSRIIIVEQHYMNWSGGQGGDTQSVQRYISSSLNTHAIRNNEAFAVSNEIALGNTSVVLANAYQYFYNLIANGYETQGSFSWHIADGNVHFSQLGHDYMSDLIFQTIQAQSGWLASLS